MRVPALHFGFRLALKLTGLNLLSLIAVSHKLFIWHGFEMWLGQQTPLHFDGVVKVTVSQVQTRATHSQPSHSADWMTRQSGLKTKSYDKPEVSLGWVSLDQKLSIIKMSSDLVYKTMKIILDCHFLTECKIAPAILRLRYEAVFMVKVSQSLSCLCRCKAAAQPTSCHINLCSAELHVRTISLSTKRSKWYPRALPLLLRLDAQVGWHGLQA